MSTLAIAEQGAILRLLAGRLRVEKHGELLRDLPAETVDEVLLVGGVQATTGAIRHLLARGARLHLLTTQGRYLGRLEPADSGGAGLLRAQVRRADDPAFTFAVAHKLVVAKVENSRVVLARLARERPSQLLKASSSLLSEVSQALVTTDSLEALRGLEGLAAQAYFGALGEVIPPGWGPFPGRRRRPPTDPVNALLSFGYSLLLTRVSAALQQVGLHPAIGFLHVSHGTRPALALDLMEEYRAPLVDRMVLGILSRRLLRPEQFTAAEGGVYLNAEARTRFLELFAARLSEKFTVGSRPIAYRETFLFQARAFAAHLRGEASYQPLRIR